MSACNRLDLQTLGSQPTMPKNFPYYRFYNKRIHIYYTTKAWIFDGYFGFRTHSGLHLMQELIILKHQYGSERY